MPNRAEINRDALVVDVRPMALAPSFRGLEPPPRDNRKVGVETGLPDVDEVEEHLLWVDLEPEEPVRKEIDVALENGVPAQGLNQNLVVDVPAEVVRRVDAQEALGERDVGVEVRRKLLGPGRPSGSRRHRAGWRRPPAAWRRRRCRSRRRSRSISGIRAAVLTRLSTRRRKCTGLLLGS